ncbi:MAG: hypothetical protein HFH12_04455 [Dorea sp.]|nr:hypothetical protein [Dorea sp.]
MKGERFGMNDFNMVLISRKQLYDEIWKISVAGVAKKYNLHYAKLIKSLKSYDIPYPSSGYWTRLACGKDVSGETKPLPQKDFDDIYLYPADYSFVKKHKQKDDNQHGSSEEQKSDIQNEVSVTKTEKNYKCDMPITVLSFLEEEERERVINELENIQVKPNSRIHPVLIEYKKSIEEWKKHEQENTNIRRGCYGYFRGQKIEQPIFTNEVSELGLKRIIVILDTIYKVIEKLGGEIKQDLSMKIREDVVRVSFMEGQDKKTHELTNQEAKALLEYKEKIKFQQYASKPRIKKYDYYYNGKLRIKFSNGKYFRDNEQQKIEDRIDKMIVELYEISEGYRIEREKREAEHQRYLEEQQRIRELAERKELEKQKTQELVNEAKDYQIACEIRNYIAALKEKNKSDETEWFKWAEEKADWFDPTISLENKWLGKRNHKADIEEKQLISKKRQSSYNW